MNTARDQIRDDMDKRPEQLQREADEVRVDMEHTVDELANQFSPGELINQAMVMFRGSGDAHFIRNLSTQIQNNPVPTILAGVGLTWLMTASKQPPERSAPGGPSRARQSAGQKLSHLADQARGSTQQASESARQKQQHLAQGASDMKERLSDNSHQAMGSARSGARSVRDRYDTMLQEQPLMLGAMAIAAGAALGALIPRTKTEDQTLGEVSDEQKQVARHHAQEMKEQAESKVEEKLNEHRSQTARSPEKDAKAPTNSGATGVESSTRTGEKGVPVANPSSVPEHPATNPPSQNHSDDQKP